MTTHFGKFDERGCKNLTGDTRQITTDPNEVTCPECRTNDRLILTPQGAETLRSLGYSVPA